MAGEVVYFEIPVADPARAHAFYGGLFGWEFAPGNFPGYEMIPNASPLGALDASGGGGAPRIFFGVADIVTDVERVRDLGGRADEPVTIPSGRFARCHDDQGTPFTLWQAAGAG